MKKDSIIDIISNDLKEMQLLLDNFRGDEPIPTAFIDLLSAKHNNIGKEVELLAFWSEEKTKVKVEEVDSYVVEKETKVEVQLENDLCEPEYADKTNENDRVEEKQEDPKPIEIAKVIEKVEQPKSEIVQSQKAKNSTKASDVKMYGTPVSDIKKAIAIADRFLYQKELFCGNASDFNAAVEIANSMQSYEEAERYLVATYGWDTDDDIVISFLRAVHRRFI